jgi:hypothetical protein
MTRERMLCSGMSLVQQQQQRSSSSSSSGSILALPGCLPVTASTHALIPNFGLSQLWMVDGLAGCTLCVKNPCTMVFLAVQHCAVCSLVAAHFIFAACLGFVPHRKPPTQTAVSPATTHHQQQQRRRHCLLACPPAGHPHWQFPSVSLHSGFLAGSTCGVAAADAPPLFGTTRGFCV